MVTLGIAAYPPRVSQCCCILLIGSMSYSRANKLSGLTRVSACMCLLPRQCSVDLPQVTVGWEWSHSKPGAAEPAQSDSSAITCACRTAATLSVDLSPETHRLRTVVWAMTSWVRSPKNGMTTCYPCDGLSTPNSPPQRLVNRMLPSQFFSHFWFSFYDLLLLPLVCQISWMPLCVNSTGP